jgi:membrane protein DedA with SNARE-associated domain
VHISHLVASYGLWALFGLVAGESLGVPVPGETAIIVASAYAGTTHSLSPWMIFVVASAAAIIGGSLGFLVGHLGGSRLARRYGHWIRLDERKLKVAQNLFNTHGMKIVFVGRFVTILRTYAAFLAGTSRMNWRRFLAANLVSAIVWAATYTIAAYLAGATLRRLSFDLDLGVGGVTVVFIVGALLVTRRRLRKIMSLPETTYPGAEVQLHADHDRALRPSPPSSLAVEDVHAAGEEAPAPGAVVDAGHSDPR